MKKIIFIIVIIILFSIGFNLFLSYQNKTTSIPQENKAPQKSDKDQNISSIEVIAENLDTPWAIAFLPTGDLLVTERSGRVLFIDKESDPIEIAKIKNVREIGEGGLLGITLHPNFTKNNFVYLYYTYQSDGNNTLNRVVRLTYKDKKLFDEKIIVDKIPGAPNHNGGRIKFGPDGYLYITTGDAQEPSLSQNTNSLAGKILRVTDEGRLIDNNPFNNAVYSYGHRNPQGLAWSDDNRLWSTEHGPSGGIYGRGHDEINLIEAGKNYGWPEIIGDQSQEGMVKPIIHSGSDTWAPAGAAIINNILYFGGLRGEALYGLNLSNTQELKVYFKGEYGRIREVIKGPDDMLYITTSNRDGRGIPRKSDDKIFRINPNKL